MKQILSKFSTNPTEEASAFINHQHRLNLEHQGIVEPK
jgi:hypothetical protein